MMLKLRRKEGGMRGLHTHERWSLIDNSRQLVNNRQELSNYLA